MNKTVKTLIIVGISLVAVGSAMAYTSFSVRGFRWDTVNNGSDYVQHTYTYPTAKVTELSVSDISCDVRVVGNSGKDDITIDCYENDDDYYDIKLSDSGTLSVEFSYQKNWFDFFWNNVGLEDRTLTIYVSESLLNNIDISTVSGDIIVSNFKLNDKLNIKTTSGTVDINNLDAGGKITANSVSGDFELKNMNSAKLELDTISGKISITSVLISGDVSLKTTSGDIELTKTSVLADVTADSTSGKIEFSDLIGSDFSFRSVSGDIRGLILGNLADYTIDAHSLSGNVTMPRSGIGEKLLKASTTSGNIDIDITQSSESAE